MTNHVDRLPGFLLQKDRFKKGKQKNQTFSQQPNVWFRRHYNVIA